MPGLFHTIKPQNAKWPRKLHPMWSTSTWTFSMLGSGISVETVFTDLERQVLQGFRRERVRSYWWCLRCTEYPTISSILWMPDLMRPNYIGQLRDYYVLSCWVDLVVTAHDIARLGCQTSHCRMSLAPWAQRSNVRSRGSDMIRVAAFLCSFKRAVTKTKCQWRFYLWKRALYPISIGHIEPHPK